jgi:hypothetical protein
MMAQFYKIIILFNKSGFLCCFVVLFVLEMGLAVGCVVVASILPCLQ